MFSEKKLLIVISWLWDINCVFKFLQSWTSFLCGRPAIKYPPNLPGSSLEFVKRNSIAIICWTFSKVICMQTVWIFRKMFRFHHLSHLNVGYLFYYRRILNSEIIREWRVWKLKTESHLSITGPTTFFWRIINAKVQNLSLNIFKFLMKKGMILKHLTVAA